MMCTCNSCTFQFFNTGKDTPPCPLCGSFNVVKEAPEPTTVQLPDTLRSWYRQVNKVLKEKKT